jgi:hypothetical protein
MKKARGAVIALIVVGLLIGVAASVAAAPPVNPGVVALAGDNIQRVHGCHRRCQPVKGGGSLHRQGPDCRLYICRRPGT